VVVYDVLRLESNPVSPIAYNLLIIRAKGCLIVFKDLKTLQTFKLVIPTLL
jgi:hypothetical protein